MSLPWTLGGLVLVVALVAGVGLGWTSGRLNGVVCGGPCGPEAVAPPSDLVLDATPRKPVAEPVVSGRLDPAAVKEAVEPLLGDADLGDAVGAVVIGADGEVAYDRQGSQTFLPASTTKLLTGFAALAVLDPATRFQTTTVLDGDRVVLVGGGDPYLAARRPDQPTRVDRADLRTLAQRTAEALGEAGLDEVTLGYDTSLFEGPSASPAWEDSYVPGQVVTPISPLWADRGLRDGIRSGDPARAAAERFAGYLEDAGIDVDGDPASAEAPDSALDLAVVQGATLAQVVDAMLVRSDNEAAEVLLRQVAVATGRPGSFEGGAEAVREALAEAAVPVDGLELNDGSGLSRKNRIAPITLARVLQVGATRASTADLLADLPVGGLTGTLAERYSRGADGGAGLVRAKTGTLTGVHSLAGYTTDRRGVPLVFAVMTDDTEAVAPLATQAAIDDVATALADCTCSR